MATDNSKENLVLFPKTLDYYQIQLTRMLETERYGDAKALLLFLLQCGGEAERHHTEWQALLGWLDAAFPTAQSGSLPAGLADASEDEEDAREEEDWLRLQVEQRTEADREYVPRLLEALAGSNDPERQLLALSQLAHVRDPEAEAGIRRWLAGEERHPAVQFRALQALRKMDSTEPALLRRGGESIALDPADVPLKFEDFPPAVHRVLEKVKQAAEVSDPSLSYFAEEMWKECAQAAFGTPIYRRMSEDDEGATDVWSAALHQFLLEKLHGATSDDAVREQYGITDELRFGYEQSLRWLRQYAAEGKT
jgi:hypothetical protein